MKTFSAAAILLAINLTASTVSHAADSDSALLTVTGKITNPNSADKKSHVFSFAELQALGNTTIQSTTPYAAKAQYTGPLMRDILKAAGAAPGATKVILVGVDGYLARAPMSDFQKWDVVAAHSQNGARMSLETKGPIWLMYPLDKNQKVLGNNDTATKLVWNLVTIKVQ